MQAPVLDDKRKEQLDKNLRAMAESGASPDDIRKYATEFKAKFTTETEAKKKSGRFIRACKAFIAEWRS